MSRPSLSEVSVSNQRAALAALYKLVIKATKDPHVREVALAMIDACDGRDDKCELEAIYNAVKSGNSRVAGFEKGVKYVTDPEAYTDDGSDTLDHYTTPQRLIEQCERGICAEDCDGHAALIASLAATVGFQTGLRIFKPSGEQYFTHVYAVVGYPKLEPERILGMDSTVPEAYVGWEPSGGETLTITASDDLAKLIKGH